MFQHWICRIKVASTVNTSDHQLSKLSQPKNVQGCLFCCHGQFWQLEAVGYQAMENNLVVSKIQQNHRLRGTSWFASKPRARQSVEQTLFLPGARKELCVPTQSELSPLLIPSVGEANCMSNVYLKWRLGILASD